MNPVKRNEMKPIELLGFGPTRAVDEKDGQYIVSVTPPRATKLPTQILALNKDQYLRYEAWRAGKGLIQEMLPDLTPDEREVLLTGIGNDDFHEMFGEDDHD
jgi:hypothetical protein